MAGESVSEEEAAQMIETVDVRKRASDGSPLIFYEQFIKITLDLSRAQYPPAFKFPWQ